MEKFRELSLLDKIYITEELCNRLPNHTKALVIETGEIISIVGIKMMNDFDKHENAIWSTIDADNGKSYHISEIRPYLRSLSKMNEDEKNAFYERIRIGNTYEIEKFYKLCHFDNKGFIKAELFIEAPEDLDIYSTKNYIL